MLDSLGWEVKASQFTDAQKAFILKQGEEGVPVAEICRKAGISQATYTLNADSALKPTGRSSRGSADRNV